MDPRPANAAELQGILGYLNFSTGKPDPRVQAQIFSVWTSVAAEPSSWLALHDQLESHLTRLHSEGHAAFKDVQQVRAVLDLGMRQLPTAYRQHHADLLFHQGAVDLEQPGFLVRALEAVLGQQGPWVQADRIVAGALKQLNSYVGHRPIAILESRPEGEPYDHEKLCPIPLYLRGAGIAPGRYKAMVEQTLALLRSAPPGLLSDASFDLDHLDELALDPRGYDHSHPADRRPNYRFGEWDPSHIDTRGNFRRFVVRQLVLDGLLERMQNTTAGPTQELLLEGATVLAGTILMASGISGSGPDTHDSSVTLSTLMPRIARYRDTFYKEQLAKIPGNHGERLRQEAKVMRQPFGGARQHINQFLAQNQAAQLQQRVLALLLAELGYPEAARRHAARVPVASLRLLAEIHIDLTTCQMLAQQGKHEEASGRLTAAETAMHRAIACGAMVDPWNILGFQGLYPLFTAREDSVQDRRIDELLQVVDRLLTQYAHLRGEAAAAGNKALGTRLTTNMKRLAAWWDRFATTSVNDVQHISGGEAAESAEHVAETLARWHARGETPADLAFWRQHLQRFRTAKSFALVVEELLRKHDFKAAMGLLVHWLAQAENVPLQDGDHSFHTLAMRWMMGLIHEGADVSASHVQPEAVDLIRKFIDNLEANAEDYWQVPKLDRGLEHEELLAPAQGGDDDEEEALFGAAYEGVTYKDSTDDGNEGELLGFEPQQEFELEHQTEAMEQRLRFLSTLAKLFHLASRRMARDHGQSAALAREIVEGWLMRALRNYHDLLDLMDAIHDRAIPAPSGAYESLVEFDRRNHLKIQLLRMVLGACLDSALAVGSMMGAVTRETDGSAGKKTKRPRWERAVLDLEQALWRGDAEAARRLLPRFLESFQHEPLLITPLEQGGHPRLILRAAIAQTLLRALAANLPRLGLLRETYGLLRVARTMEQQQKLQGVRQTEFDQLYRLGCQASFEAAAAALNADTTLSAPERIDCLGRLVQPFLEMWSEYARTVRRSILEAVSSDEEWNELVAFIRKYGGGLFHARFMTLANLRGILQRGVGPWLKYVEENPDPLQPVSLIDDLDRRIPRAKAQEYLQVVLQAVVENYEEYRDYNTTTTQSDYGENLYMLLEFLRLKARYDRHAWALWPLVLVHEVLAKHSSETAALWQVRTEKMTSKGADQYVAWLATLEKEHGLRLRTISDLVRERFVQPLALDRVCALIEPAYDQARAGQPAQALDLLERDLKPYLSAPTGAGLNVPHWLRRLEAEVQRVEQRHTAIANLAESLLQVPQLILATSDLQAQLQNWPKP